MLLQTIKDSTYVPYDTRKDVMYPKSEQLSLENQVTLNMYSTYSTMILIHIIGSSSNI